MDNPTYLIHHGVKGQRWGVRKSRNKLSRKQRKNKAQLDEWSSAHKDYRNARNKPVSQMSDAELQRNITRLQKEKQYKDLQPKNISRGKRAIVKTWKGVLGVATAASTALGTYIAINNNLVGIKNANLGERIKK